MTPVPADTPRARLLARAAAAIAADPSYVGAEVAAALRDEIALPVQGMLGHVAGIVEEYQGEGRDRLVAGVRRVHAAASLLLPLADDVLDPARVPPGRYADEWEALGGRLEDYLLPGVAAVSAFVEMLVEDPVTLGHDRLVTDLYQVRSAAAYLAELVDDVVQLLAVAQGTLPASLATDAVRAALEPHPLPDPARRVSAARADGTVLVVDDSEVNRELLGRVLTRIGYAVEMAHSGAEALERAGRGGIDLVLLDIIMPEVDGFQVLHQLKRDPRTHAVPVIVVSALDEVESVARCIEIGAEDYLTKPFDPVLLRARIGSTLEKRRLLQRVARAPRRPPREAAELPG